MKDMDKNEWVPENEFDVGNSNYAWNSSSIWENVIISRGLKLHWDVKGWAEL